MKRVLVALLCLSSLATSAQVVAPAASPGSTLTSIVGLTEIKVEYSRPKAKGRKIFGDGPSFVTSYGVMWRTGANSGTNVSFNDDVKFGGMDVTKGTYRLMTIPGATDWIVILSKDMDLQSNAPANYDMTKEAARVTVKSEKLTEKVETFTIQISDIADNSKSANLQLMWENTSVKVPITVDFDKKVMASIDANTKVNPNALYTAANYYLENGKDLKVALDWINTASTARPDAYWIMHSKAKILKAMGDKNGATQAANASKAEATKQKDDAYVKMNDELLKGLK